MSKKIFAGFLDEMVIFGCSAVTLLLFEGILRIIGFTMVVPSFFLVFILAIFNALYFPILEGGKYNTTIGKRILKIDDETI